MEIYNGDDVYDVSKNSSSFIVQLATDYEFKIITSDALVGEDVIVANSVDDDTDFNTSFRTTLNDLTVKSNIANKPSTYW